VVAGRAGSAPSWTYCSPPSSGIGGASSVPGGFRGRLIESELLEQYDVAVVFTGDTDLLPALELAFRRTPPRIEIACWQGAEPLWFPEGLSRQPRRLLPYCHFLDRADFDAVRDETDYLAGR
jgi:hypothetical protein